MATRIVDLDLDSPLPDTLPLEGHAHIQIVAWKDGVPAGSLLLERDPDSGDVVPINAALAALAEAAPGRPPASDRPLPSISVVICTRDRPDRLPIALDALRQQTHRDFELIIVDNAPRDSRTHRVVKAHWPDAVYVVEPVPGLPRARNTGNRVARGRVVAFIDDDCRPIPLWVESIARRFAADSALGCVTGPILPLELQSPAQEAMERRGGFNRGFQRRRYTLETPDGPVYPVQAWKFGAGGSLALTRDCLRDLGGFDVALWRSEDLDIVYRTLRAGYALSFEPAAAVRHRHLPTWSALRRRLFHWGWGYLTYLDKIVRTDSLEYSRRAREERRNWLVYQVRRRLGAAAVGGGEVGVPLVLAELAGGVAGYRGYPLARRLAAREVARLRQREPAPMRARASAEPGRGER